MANQLPDAEPQDAVPVLLSRDDLDELARILTGERYRMDKGDGSPVPQPRWAANVRISQVIERARGAIRG